MYRVNIVYILILEEPRTLLAVHNNFNSLQCDKFSSTALICDKFSSTALIQRV